MLSYFLLIVGFLLLFVIALSYLAKADPRLLGKAVRYIGGMILLAVAVALVARGLIFYAIPIGILGYSLLQGRTPFGSSFPGSAKKSTGQQSRVRTDTIEMRLDHDSGDMEGMVLRGKFANRMLSDLELNDLVELWSECRQSDDQAAKLLEAYIDRAHPDWREAAGHAEGEDESARGASGGPMSMDEAYEILGLAPGASASEIRRAHRTLMKKLHPDQGGSTYLASKINEAKDLLLKR